jgi:peptide/nickel transport system permease protein
MSVQSTSVAAGGVVPDTRPVLTKKHTRARFAVLRNTKALVGMIILGFFILMAIIGPWIAPYDPSAVTRESLAPPSAAHWLGTTNTGQDILSQLMVGTRGVMVVGLLAGVLATAISIVIGVTAGFIGGTGTSFFLCSRTCSW